MVALLRQPMRLVTDDYAELAFLPPVADDGAERRMFPRKVWRASVEGRRLDHSIPARQQPQLTLELRDLSVGGYGYGYGYGSTSDGDS